MRQRRHERDRKRDEIVGVKQELEPKNDVIAVCELHAKLAYHVAGVEDEYRLLHVKLMSQVHIPFAEKNRWNISSIHVEHHLVKSGLECETDEQGGRGAYVID